MIADTNQAKTRGAWRDGNSEASRCIRDPAGRDGARRIDRFGHDHPGEQTGARAVVNHATELLGAGGNRRDQASDDHPESAHVYRLGQLGEGASGAAPDSLNRNLLFILPSRRFALQN